MQTLISRKTTEISTPKTTLGITLVHASAAKQRPIGTAIARGESGRVRFVAVLLRALSACAA